MKIIKSNGKEEDVKFDKISSRIKKATYGLDVNFVDSDLVSKKVIDGLYDGVTSRELDQLAAETAAGLTSVHPDYSLLASRLAITSFYKDTEKSFSKNIKKLYNYIDPETGKKAGLIGESTYKTIMDNAAILDSAIVHDRDFLHDYFGFRTLYNAYLLRMGEKPMERIQHMWMRVAVGIWGEDIEGAIKLYNRMSQKFMTHATPTLFNAGTRKPQMSSCFLLGNKGDSIDGIYNTLHDVAMISKHAGGIGVHIHDVRARGSYIRGTNGISEGIVPMLKVYNETARYVNQAGKRKGSFAFYLEPWHADVFDFLDLRKTHGKEEMRARDLFTALWCPDLFFKRVEEDGNWSLMCPDKSPGLSDVYGDEFTALYERYEAEGRFIRVVKAQELWDKITESQIESGTPYMAAKDAGNQKSNQKNIGIIKSSNLCIEIFEVSTAEEQAVCNLASVAVCMYYTPGVGMDYQALYDDTYLITLSLNKVIDVNYYPTEETKLSNMRHRPIAIGLQGLADLFAMAKVAFESPEAADLNKKIYETMAFASITASKDLAKVDGPYETYEGSPISQGIFQFDMWEDVTVKPVKGKLSIIDRQPIKLSGLWDWDALRAEIKQHGVRNSLNMAQMPTASTSNILGNNESNEPFTSNIYARKVLSGEFMMVNKHLIKDLISVGLWNDDMRQLIMSYKGSVQSVEIIPEDIRTRYKTVWEMKQRPLLDMAAERSAFICQSQSMNLFIPNDEKMNQTLTTSLMYGWKKGLKTLSYYIRTKAALSANAGLGLDRSKLEEIKSRLQARVETKEVVRQVFTQEEALVCKLNFENGNALECMACGS